MTGVTPVAVAALVLELIPAALFECAAEAIGRRVRRWPMGLRMGGNLFLLRRYGRALLSRMASEFSGASRVGRLAALVIASVLFGLSHFNKRSAHFNWVYSIWRLG